MLNLFAKICNRLDRISCTICFLTTLVMTAITFINIVIRVIFGVSISWSSELARYMFVWSTLIGGSIAVHRSQLAATTMFVDKLFGKVKWFVMIAAESVILFFSMFCIYYGISLTIKVCDQETAALGISMSYVYISVPICFILVAIYTIYKLKLLINKEHMEFRGEIK